MHLRLHSEFSVTDGIVRLPEAIKAARKNQMPALALTDLNNMFGLLKFYRGAREKGIKPICGVDVWVEGLDNAAPSRVLIFVQNVDGYRRLCALLTRAYLENDGTAVGPAMLRRQWLSAESCQGLIALSGAGLGDVGQALLAGNGELAKRCAADWLQRFPDRFYLEIQRYDQPEQDALVQASIALAHSLDLPLVATHPIQFMEKDDFEAHEARVCIAEGYTLADRRRPKNFTPKQYFTSQEEMAALFADVPEALTNTVRIAQRCNLELTIGKNYLPIFPTPNGESLDDYLVDVAKKGLCQRMAQLYPDIVERERQREKYENRLSFECDTIIQMGFPGYFLIVADFINWAKNNNVPVGPGRGSGAGSLVAFSIGITDIDPLAYALLFERFLNPERVSMPDFDVDFCQDNRGRVIDYVRRHYGEQAVSQIATFGTMSSKAVVRDVGRVLNLPYSLCDRISKLIPVVQNKPSSLEDALATEPQLTEMMADERDGEAVREIFALASKLEDLTRNVGMHAGGVLIAPGKITDFCPMYKANTHDAVSVSQFDKDDVEKIGLVKFDFLGLRNLTIIKLALDYIEKLEGERPDLMAQGFCDPETYQILRDANTTAVFQVESEGMKKLLKKLAPDRFEDIIAVLALYRPGPLGSGMVDDFIQRKKGLQEIDYFHPDLKACLEPTYGVIIYQEQVMQISQIIGGYTLGGADMLRRAMGKKKPEEMAKHRTTIAEGARKKGYPPELAEHLFDLMAKFAEYGFNKSHTAAYAVVTYHTAWLKKHHTAAFMAATMSSDMDNTDTVKIFFDDAVKNKLIIEPPSINESEYKFVPVDNKHIRYGLGAVKGTGNGAVEEIIAARNSGGDFKSLFDFCRRCNKQHVNRRVIEALIRSGACDGFGEQRSVLLASVGKAIEYAEQEERNAQQCSLFGDEDSEFNDPPPYEQAKPWSLAQKLMEEKTALGFFLSDHLYSVYKDELRRSITYPLNALKISREAVRVAGIVVSIRSIMSKRGKMMFVTLDDGKNSQEISIFNELFLENRDKIAVDKLLLIEGRVFNDKFNDAPALRPERIMDINDIRRTWARQINLHISAGQISAAELHAILQPHRQPQGGCQVRIEYQTGDVHCVLQSHQFNVDPNETLMNALVAELGEKAVQLQYHD